MDEQVKVNYVDGDLPVCDRCGDLWRVAEVQPDLPCCPVPLCDECADLHRIEVSDGVV